MIEKTVTDSAETKKVSLTFASRSPSVHSRSK